MNVYTSPYTAGRAIQEQARQKDRQREPRGQPRRQQHKDGDRDCRVHASGAVRPQHKKEVIECNYRGVVAELIIQSQVK